MTLSKFKFSALLAALTLTFAGSAAAIVPQETSTHALTFTGGNTILGNTISAGFPAFDDYFTFSVPGASTGTLGASVVAGITFAPILSLTSELTSFDLYRGTPGASSSLLAPVTWIAPGMMGYTGANGLASGNYFLEAKGWVIDPSVGGSYGGTANLVLAPVPEPGEWALMLSGLGLIGFMVRRRTSGGT